MKRFLISAMLLSAFTTVPAQALILTFDSQGQVQNNYPDSYTGIGDTYLQDGFTLSVGAGNHFDSMDASGLYFHDGPANDITDVWAQLSHSGGQFDLGSFQFNFYSGDFMTNLNPTPTTYAIGTIALNLTGLTWVAFSPTSGGLFLDNVQVSSSGPVPEPGLTSALDSL